MHAAPPQPPPPAGLAAAAFEKPERDEVTRSSGADASATKSSSGEPLTTVASTPAREWGSFTATNARRCGPLALWPLASTVNSRFEL